jgi:hypothetical protein
VSELTTRGDGHGEIREGRSASSRDHVGDQPLVRGEHGSSERIADDLLRERLQDLRLLTTKIRQELLGTSDCALVGEFSRDVDGFAVGVGVARSAEVIEALERKAERVDPEVATRASRVALVLREAIAKREAAERDGIGLDRAGVRRRGRGGCTEMRRSTQSPRFTGLVRSGAEVTVRIDPSRKAPPRPRALAPSTFTTAPVDFTSTPVSP